MHPIDWLIVGSYLTYVVWGSVNRSNATGAIKGYFLANRSLPWWAVGLSIMATQMSAITLVGSTGQAFDDGMRFIQFYLGLPLAMVILCLTVVPFFYRAKVYTAYEYLENRFDSRTRTLASMLFLVSRGLSCGVIIAAPAVILSVVLGWELSLTVLAIGVPTVVYTMLGGVQAVTWADVKQMSIIIIGITAVIMIIVSQLPSGVSMIGAMQLAAASGRLTTVDFSFDLKSTYTFWSGLLGGTFLMLSYFGCDQSQVQRYLTARSLSESRVSLLMSAFLKIPIQFAILLLGVLVFVFYNFSAPPILFNQAQFEKVENQPRFEQLVLAHKQASENVQYASRQFLFEKSATSKDAYLLALRERQEIRGRAIQMVQVSESTSSFSDVNYVFPSFVINNLPIGMVGLIVAAIFAAAMSSVSSELNALSTATVMDFYRRLFRPNEEEKHYLRFSKIVTGVWGLAACAVAVYASQLGSLIEVVNRLGSFFYGSLLGVFVLAIATRWATPLSASIGLIGGMIAVAGVSLLTEISFLWYNLVGVSAVILVAFLISWWEGAFEVDPGLGCD